MKNYIKNKCSRKFLFILLAPIFMLGSCRKDTSGYIHPPEITKWQGDKKSAISITYDDGIITQFTVAKPIMDSLGLPGTFYIITGKIAGAQKGKFIGRPAAQIIRETASIKTNSENFFERASLIGFTGKTEGVDYHSRAGSLYESGKTDAAFRLVDEGFKKVREGKMKDLEEVIYHDNPEDTTSWENLKQYGEQGHEIASHTVTHPRLAVLDEPNLIYELSQSKTDIENYLGKEYTFSAECPYGTEDERVMEYAHKIYPALRNRMPADYLEELNRSSKKQPGASDKEYVQWQRGPLTKTPLNDMKGWIDTCLVHDNIWLVLVFHGVDEFGWEAKTEEELRDYFNYISAREDQLWVATFADVTKYIRERKGSKISANIREDTINVSLISDLDPQIYNVPLTLKIYLPDNWTSVTDGEQQVYFATIDSIGKYILYDSSPSEKVIQLMKHKN